MGKITDRREKTAHTVIENKAVLAEGKKPKSEFPYKKLLIAVLIVVAIVACVLLVLNAFVDTYADKFNTGIDLDGAVANKPVTDDGFANQLLDEHSAAYLAAVNNHNKQYSNIKSDPNVYNYITTISSEQIDGDSAGVSVIMLMSLDKTTNQISYVAINKSTLVEIPTVGVRPLYDAYEYGSAALLARTVQENFGIEIKGYVEMPLESFVQASLDVGGIVVADELITDDEKNLNTAAKIYNYVKEADDRNAAMTKVIDSLATKSSDAGVFGLKNVVDTISDSLNASIEREDFSDLLTILVKAFNNDKTVAQIAYATAEPITEKDIPSLNGVVIVDYDFEINVLQSILYSAQATK